MTPESLITDALDTLCWRARVSPDDGSLAAGDAVCSVLLRDGVRAAPGSHCSPNECPMALWLQSATGLENPDRLPHLPLLLLGAERVILMRPVAGGRRGVVFVPLPAAVVTAVRLISELRQLGLIRRAAA